MPAPSAYESSASRCEELIGLLHGFSVYIPGNRLNLRIGFKSVAKIVVDYGVTWDQWQDKVLIIFKAMALT